MPHPKKNRDTEIRIRCRKQLKIEFSKKLIACGYGYTRDTDVLAYFADFLEVLNSKDLEWFKKNFQKTVDK